MRMNNTLKTTKTKRRKNTPPAVTRREQEYLDRLRRNLERIERENEELRRRMDPRWRP